MTTSVAELKQRGNQKQEVARSQKTIFDFLTGDPKIEKAIAAVATQYLTADRFLRLAVNAVKKTPLLMQCDPQTVLGSFMTSAALGLEPNTIMQQAFLIPYKKRQRQGNEWIDTYDCQFQVGARGFVTLAHRSPEIDSLQSEAIHEGDFFEHMLGTESFLKYRKALKDRGQLIGSFCFTKLASGTEMATVLPLDEIEKIRSKSETYNALMRNIQSAQNHSEKEKAEKKLAETPWVMWADDMAAKSATKKHAKQLPLTPGDGLAAAVALDADGAGVIDMAVMTDPDMVKTVFKDGVDAVDAERAGYKFAAVENDPSPTLQPMKHRAAQAETVEARQSLPEQHRGEQRQADDGVTYAQVASAMERAADIDALEVEADLIAQVESEVMREELRTLYRTCRDRFESDQPRQAASRPARRQMNLD